jgi:ubiquinone/menaquinone biosynthesis C-methylase UbiE
VWQPLHSLKKRFLTHKSSDHPPQESANQFNTVAPLYDLLMTGVPYDDWVDYLMQLIRSRKAEPGRVLDLACGTGNVSELLAKHGFKVTGVDISELMIVEAKRKAALNHFEIDYFVQDAAVLNLPGQQFDMCVSFFDSMNYIIQPERLAMAFVQVAAHLKPGGLFIFDVNSEFALKNRFFDQDNLAHPEERLTYDWKSSYYPKTRICTVNMKFWYREDNGERRAFEETHLQFAYRKDELEAMLAAAGFEHISVYHAYTMLPPSRTSDRLFFVAQRRNETESATIT